MTAGGAVEGARDGKPDVYSPSRATCRRTRREAPDEGATRDAEASWKSPHPNPSPARAGEGLYGRNDYLTVSETSDATLFVCVTCKSGDDRPGQVLFDALSERLRDEARVTLRAVECLSVCKRPCTVALAARGKWTYVVGDLALDSHLDDIVTAARRFAATSDGLVPWRERPLPFRKGVISRTPPLTL
jgi:predicted metal-binding protein